MKKINVLITIMLLALISLIAFQWYWIQNAIAVKNEQFDRKVMDTLNETVEKIEKQEIIFLTKQRFVSEEKNRILAISKMKKKEPKKHHEIKDFPIDSLQVTFEFSEVPFINNIEGLDNRAVTKNDIYQHNIIIFPKSQDDYVKSFLNEEYKAFEKFNQTSTELANKQNDINDVFKLFNSDIIEHPIEQHLELHTQRPIQNRTTNNKKADLVKDVFKDLIIGKRSVYERFNHIMLDTLLKGEFNNHGINIPFEYRVKDNNNMIFASLGMKNKIDAKEYEVKLFPHDSFPQKQYLQVYFPDRDRFIYKNLWNVFGTSMLLICMVGGIFYYSVNTLLSQKKLAAIKNDFINNMTHELKTPVSTISLALQFLKDKDLAKNEVKTERYLGIIEQENNRLGKQVEKVLQIAQVEKGDVKLKLENINAKKLLEDVVAQAQLQAEIKEADIRLICEAENHEIIGDKLHLTNIFNNLIDNATKYAADKPEIEIRTKNQNENLVILIKDKGIGIAKDQIPKIFDKFYRVPTGDLHDVKGYGLGLSYVKNMLDLHHASIHVESKLNEGSTFIITIPNNENIIS